MRHPCGLAFSAVSLSLAACGSAGELETHASQSAISLEPVIELPARAGYDPDFEGIKVSRLAAGTEIQLTLARHRSTPFGAQTFCSSALFAADRSGTVDTRQLAPISGSYEGIDPFGLFWSMQKCENVTAPADGEFVLSVATKTDGINLSRTFVIGGERTELEEVALDNSTPGAFAMWEKGNTAAPAILIFGGSEGGSYAALLLAPRFASMGFVAVGVPYFSPSWGGAEWQVAGLQGSLAAIDLELVEKVTRQVRDLPVVSDRHPILFGASKGAELVLAAAARIPEVCAVIAIAPSDTIWQGWGPSPAPSSFVWRGAPLAFMPYVGMGDELVKQDPDLRTVHDQSRNQGGDYLTASRIRVEAIAGPVFLVAGDQDEIWDAGQMARNIADYRDRAGLITELHVSETAGHQLAGDLSLPNTKANIELLRTAYPAMREFLVRQSRSQRCLS